MFSGWPVRGRFYRRQHDSFDAFELHFSNAVCRLVESLLINGLIKIFPTCRATSSRMAKNTK
jgi:hypothetical protein